LRRTLDYSEDSTQPVSANSSVCEGPSSPVQVEHPMEVEATHSQEVESLKRLLQEVCAPNEWDLFQGFNLFAAVLKSCSLSLLLLNFKICLNQRGY